MTSAFISLIFEEISVILLTSHLAKDNLLFEKFLDKSLFKYVHKIFSTLILFIKLFNKCEPIKIEDPINRIFIFNSS